MDDKKEAHFIQSPPVTIAAKPEVKVVLVENLGSSERMPSIGLPSRENSFQVSIPDSKDHLVVVAPEEHKKV